MARLKSRFGKAAKARRRQERPSKAQRLARAPRPPRGAELAFSLIARRFVGKLERAAIALEPLEPVISYGVVATHLASAGIAKKAQRHSQSEFRRLGIDLRGAEPGIEHLIRDWRKVNVERITSLGEHERKELADILASGSDKTVTEIRQAIRERFEVTRAKADLLARDQVLTLNAQINQTRAVAAGLTEFFWTTSGDARVRESHEAIDGDRFEYAEPPEVDGEHVLPGQPINCRCVASPILPDSD